MLRLALLCVSRLSEGYTSFGKLHLWRLDERPSGSFTSGGVLRLSERPSGSFTSGGFPKEANVLREASPLAAFRRKRTSFGKLHLWRLSERSLTSGGFLLKASPLAGWRLSEGSQLVLKKARPSASSRRKGVLRFLREASPLAGRSPFPKEAPEVPEGSNLF